MKSFKWMISYCVFSVLGLFTAFYLVSGFLKPAQSQESMPPSGDIPVEFFQDEGIKSGNEPAKSFQDSNAAGGASNAPVGNVPPPPQGAYQDVDAVTAPSVPIFSDVNYIYDSAGKRDPFEPYRKAKGVSVKKVDIDVRDPLQMYPTDKYSVIGILWEVNKPRAMVKDPDGIVHVVVKNTRIGKNEGYVAVIREGEIVVVETLYDEGNPAKHTVVLSLKK